MVNNANIKWTIHYNPSLKKRFKVGIALKGIIRPDMGITTPDKMQDGELAEVFEVAKPDDPSFKKLIGLTILKTRDFGHLWHHDGVKATITGVITKVRVLQLGEQAYYESDVTRFLDSITS
jgi:hypothetical protein